MTSEKKIDPMWIIFCVLVGLWAVLFTVWSALFIWLILL